VRFDAISEAWTLFQQQIGTWVVTILIFLVLTVIVVYGGMFAMFIAVGGIAISAKESATGVSQPMPPIFPLFMIIWFLAVVTWSVVAQGGLFRMAIKQVRGEAISPVDLFTTVDVLPSLLGAGLMIGIASGIASLFCIIPGFIVGGLLMLAIPLIVDKRAGAFDAMSQSWSALKDDMAMSALFHFILPLTASIGVIGCGIGLFFTLPLLPLSIAVIYRDFFLSPAPYQTGPYTPPPGGYAPQVQYPPPPAGPPLDIG
jgi:uncharacterized membrane protein